MNMAPTREVAYILEYVGLSLYLPLLLDEGFDDVETLRDMTEDDMVELGIKANDRKSFRLVIDQLWGSCKAREPVTAKQGQTYSSLKVGITSTTTDV